MNIKTQNTLIDNCIGGGMGNRPPHRGTPCCVFYGAFFYRVFFFGCYKLFVSKVDLVALTKMKDKKETGNARPTATQEPYHTPLRRNFGLFLSVFDLVLT